MQEDQYAATLRSLQNQGLVERVDLEEGGPDAAGIVEHVLERLRSPLSPPVGEMAASQE